MTWEEFNRYLIQTEAATLIVSGLLLLMNRKCTGSLLLSAAVIFILVVKDYPWLRHSMMKSAVRERNERIVDFLKNISLLGAACLLMTDRGSRVIKKVDTNVVMKADDQSQQQ